MKEQILNIWAVQSIHWIGITTNGFVKSNGALVMGRGVAQQAKARYPGIEFELGKLVKTNGNICHFLKRRRIFTFPVKHNWMELADIDLIIKSSIQLAEIANANRESTYYLPRPGCGNGGLLWAEVKPYLEHLPDNVICVTLK